MSIMDSKGSLSNAAKDLIARWRDVKEVWSDAQSQEFEEKYLIEIEQAVRGALGVMDHMNQVLIKVKSDCE